MEGIFGGMWEAVCHPFIWHCSAMLWLCEAQCYLEPEQLKVSESKRSGLSDDYVTLANMRHGAPTFQRSIISQAVNNTRLPTLGFHLHLQDILKGNLILMCALKVHCLTDFFQHSIRLMWASLVQCAPHAHWRCINPSWQLHPHPLVWGKVRVPQVPHFTPQLRPRFQPKASQYAASWPPVDAGRHNVTHIIIHHCGELGKEGRDGELVVRGAGGQGRTLVQGS